MKNKTKGFTLVELLISTGIIGLASLGLYAIYHIADDFRKSYSETKNLSSIISNIEDFGLSKGDFSGINLGNIQNYTKGFQSVLDIQNITSEANNIKFHYLNINPRVCNSFVNNMMSYDKNITSIVNNKNISQKSLTEIAEACVIDNNEVVIIYNKPTATYFIDTVIPSINPPPTPHSDVVVPLTPVPSPVPQVPPFVPSTAAPTIYTIDGSPPVYPFIPPVGGGGVVVPGGDASAPTMPPFVPPEIPDAPPPEQEEPDAIDTEVLPPIVTTERRTISCPTNYTGSITEERTKTVYQGSGNISYSAWVAVINNCVYVPPPPPPPPASTGFACHQYMLSEAHFGGRVCIYGTEVTYKACPPGSIQEYWQVIHIYHTPYWLNASGSYDFGNLTKTGEEDLGYHFCPLP